MEERTLFGAGFLLVVAFMVVVAIIGQPAWIAAGAVFAVLLAGAMLVSRGLQARAARTDAAADSGEPVPLTSNRPAGGDLGDDLEHHDEITPHDLPVDHPARHAAEAGSDERFTRTHRGTTTGNR